MASRTGLVGAQVIELHRRAGGAERLSTPDRACDRESAVGRLIELAGVSAGDGYEPAPVVEHVTIAKLADELGSREGVPAHAMA